MNALIQDVRYGLRMLAKNPGFTAVAVLTLALGIGATTAMFSVVECAVLDPYPFPDSHRIVMMIAHDTKQPAEEYGFGYISGSELLDYQQQNHVFDIVWGQSGGDVLMTGAGGPMRLRSAPVTADYFRGLGVPALLGRPLGPQDVKPGAPPVAVFEYNFWQSMFKGDPGVVGRTFTVDLQPTTIVGVMPRRFKTFAPDIWLPAPLSKAGPPEQQTHFTFHAHLKRGVSMAQARSEVAVLAERFAKLYPKDHPKGQIIQVESILTAGMHRLQRTMYFLLGAVGLLMLIACVNVANLLLARATTREREVAIRGALGASRVRLVRQFLMESLLLALAGTTLGCLLAWRALPEIVTLIPYGAIPTQADIRINGWVLLFTIAVALLSTLLFGLAPAMHAAKKNPQQPMQESSRGAGESRAHGRLRNVLVAAEVALSLVLLSGAGLLIRTFSALQHVPLGYSPDNVLCAMMMLPPEQYKTREQRNQFSQEVLRRVRVLPGVTSAALGFPPGWGGGQAPIEIIGKPSTESQRAQIGTASDRYFETLGMRLLQGRSISEEDFANARKVAVVNRALVTKYFGNDDPLGRQIKLVGLDKMGPYSVQTPLFDVVGVVEDIRGYELEEAPKPTIYIPQTVLGAGWNPLLVRTMGKPTLMLNSIRREVAAVDKDLPLFDPWSHRDPRSLRDMLQRDWSFAQPRFITTILTVFAALGLVLVSVGVYSVLSYSVSRRTHEMGIRMALGARAPDVVRMVMLSGLKWLALGIAVGVPVSIGLVKIFQNRIWALNSSDPLTLAAVSVLLIIVGLAACYFPARRATQVDPMEALRYE